MLSQHVCVYREAIMAFVMGLANAYGLVFVIFFLGHGLVDVPKKLWFNGNRDVLLRYYEFKATSAKDTVDDTSMELLETIRVCIFDMLQASRKGR